MLKLKFFCTTLLIVLPILGISQDVINDMQNIMIRNVTVIDQTGKTEDVVVNILIKQKKLELVTQDKIALTRQILHLMPMGDIFLENLNWEAWQDLLF